MNIQSLREWVSSWGDGPNWSDASGATIPTAKATLLGLLDSIADITTARDKLAAECERLRALVNRAADSLDYCVQRHGEHSKSVRGDELRLAAIASEGGGEVSDEKTLDNKQLDMLRMIADTHHRTECASWKLLWLIDQHRALTAALATRQHERDAARDIWFCLECGITVPDAEHCCPTCGRDCIGFENGKPAHGMGAWLDKERALDAALAYQLKSPVTGAEQTLGHLMQERYGREARQWQANHDQRKAERDAAITERDALMGEVERLRLAADMLREIPRAAISSDKVYREDWPELFTDEDSAALYLDTAVDRVLNRITRKEPK